MFVYFNVMLILLVDFIAITATLGVCNNIIIDNTVIIKFVVGDILIHFILMRNISSCMILIIKLMLTTLTM